MIVFGEFGACFLLFVGHSGRPGQWGYDLMPHRYPRVLRIDKRAGYITINDISRNHIITPPPPAPAFSIIAEVVRCCELGRVVVRHLLSRWSQDACIHRRMSPGYILDSTMASR